jgi:hypothetical protein
MLELLSGLLVIQLFGSAILGIAVLGLFITFCFVADWDENGYIATTALVITSLLFYFFGKETWNIVINFITWKLVLGYLIIGIIYAIIRIFFHGRIEKNKLNKSRLEGRSSDFEYTINRNIKNNVKRWWLLWVISLIDWFLKDMIKEIYDIVYQKLSKFFNYVLELGINSVPEVPKNEKKK